MLPILRDEIKEIQILIDNINQDSFQLINKHQNDEEQKQVPAQNEQEIKAKEQKDREVAMTLEKIVQQDRPKYLEFRRLVDYHLESLKYQEMKDKPKLLPITGQTKLLYKATNDGFLAANFHQKCDNQGKTISFILSDQGQVFGGYTSLSWASNNTQYKDNDAFIFSLSKNTLHKQYQNFDYAVYHGKDYLIVFGGGHDIRIYTGCNNNTSNLNQCNLGYAYLPPQGLKYGDQQATEYLAGSAQFKVIEIEVYQVIV
ncbi:UNKNOWN [Stylonychia lemnae]|uniref:TLDc domain-containing protein n=1 Tax=Stylonychia lemnae TaxID=5949 RepID=A0A078AP18_STYLE|nr:UNKNOWN [Stylonychia lemnae]|eukprot:CDW83874.1 UNKNOWN [Stylonychia lemnae]